ncbi:beta-lactamase/transpeptidase-like protein [Immersiella caudata]|uniref:Beta-lactamase/transpeptidase-like protein n=1 Tax=Immersiella caudata TaxID=314043 RepID=A0AA39WYX7_9PEZI|nr:beta-lactamase/transpeptidase-like protein [Immersiella caudata]
MTASLDMLNRDGKTSWDSLVNSVVPEFRHNTNNAEFQVTIREICSHRTGLLSLDEITQGLDGRILIDKKDIVKVGNAMPVKNSLRVGFLYNNGLFELTGHFQRDRIFEPLGMTRTTAFRDTDEIDENFTKSYMVLTDGTPFQVPTTALSANSMNGGSGGVRSSVNNLLKWCHCLFASFGENDANSTKGNLSLSNSNDAKGILSRNSPIFNRCTISNTQDVKASDYCIGFCLHRTPAKLGLISPNRSLLHPTLGAATPSVLVYGHQGDVPENTCNLYIMPETKSAVVVLFNGTGLSDSTDWIAQDIIQTLFGLQPNVDFLANAIVASQLYLSYYAEHFEKPLASRRGSRPHPPELSYFVGNYVMETLDVAFINTVLHSDPDSGPELRMFVNGFEDQAMQLGHYRGDTFCYLPESYDECLKRGLDRAHHSEFLIRFGHDEWGIVGGLMWVLDVVERFFIRQACSIESIVGSAGGV